MQLTDITNTLALLPGVPIGSWLWCWLVPNVTIRCKAGVGLVMGEVDVSGGRGFWWG